MEILILTKFDFIPSRSIFMTRLKITLIRSQLIRMTDNYRFFE